MKLLVTCPSGLHIEFEGNYAELPHLDRFLEEIARVEAERLELRHQLDIAEHRIPVTFEWEPVSPPSPPMAPGLAAEPDGGDHRPDTPAADTAGESSRPPARVIGAQARAAMSAQLAERHGAHHAQALALVAEHGPVSPAWVADQLVKNRRDTIALMRDMAAAGELVETDEGGYYDIPDRDDQAQAA